VLKFTQFKNLKQDGQQRYYKKEILMQAKQEIKK